MNLSQRLKVFKKELNSILQEDIRFLVGKVLYKADEKFFTAPLSNSEKSCPAYALGAEGLVRHTQASVYLAKEFFATETFDLSQTEKDYIIAALILHDTCKGGTKWTSKYTKHEHPVLVRGLIDEVYLSSEEQEHWTNICNLVDTHQGKWNTNSRSTKKLPIPSDDSQKLVHLCSYLASQKCIDISIFGNKKNTIETAENSAILAVSSDVDEYFGWKARPATDAQRRALKRLSKQCKGLTDPEKKHISYRLNSNTLLSGEASELIGIVKIMAEGKATQEQIDTIKELLTTIEQKSPTGLPQDLSQMEWSMKITDGMSFERAKGMIQKLKHYEMVCS